MNIQGGINKSLSTLKVTIPLGSSFHWGGGDAMLLMMSKASKPHTLVHLIQVQTHKTKAAKAGVKSLRLRSPVSSHESLKPPGVAVPLSVRPWSLTRPQHTRCQWGTQHLVTPGDTQPPPHDESCPVNIKVSFCKEPEDKKKQNIKSVLSFCLAFTA